MATKAAQERPSYRCDECGHPASKWLGQCPGCQSWGSLLEIGARPNLGRLTPGPVSSPAEPIAAMDAAVAHARPTGVDEFDRVLGGGLVPGAVVLLAGEPGVGKSTLLLSVAEHSAGAGGRALIITGEESAAQVRLRASRTGARHPDLYLAAETDLGAVLSHVDAVAPRLVVVDSVQTIGSQLIDGSVGGVTQVRSVASALIGMAKRRDICVLLIGHVTKDGTIAGPRTLEHLVDIVLHFEGERHASLRILRAAKNRYGPTDEVGCFEMHEGGIRGLADPSGLFLSRRDITVPGTCVTVSLEGRRPLVTEVQALVARSAQATPRRAVSGLDASRVAMVLAVMERRAALTLADRDVFTATVGGVRVTEPAADLALGLAISSATTDVALPPGLTAIGELGLAGDVRPVVGVARRVAEAARLGFDRALVPVGAGPYPDGVDVTEVGNVSAALYALRPAKSVRLRPAPIHSA